MNSNLIIAYALKQWIIRYCSTQSLLTTTCLFLVMTQIFLNILMNSMLKVDFKVDLLAANFRYTLKNYPVLSSQKQKYNAVLEKFHEFEKPKTILLWTSLFKMPLWGFDENVTNPFKEMGCLVSNCILTNDQKYVDKADMVLIHFRDDFNISDLPAPYQRNSRQRWAFFLWESPYQTYDYRWDYNQRSKRTLQQFSNFFNLTMTYRLDSDLPFSYGYHKLLANPDFSQISFDRTKGKKKLVFWMTSHCDTVSHRENYVHKLAHYIDVDILGSCFPSQVSDELRKACLLVSYFNLTNDRCMEYISENYMFYLSFENSHCRDYVTEKFYQPAMLNLIPVVMNGADMSLFAPPHSFIDVRDFSHPAKLAQYLKIVAANKDLYNSYFWWKPYYEVGNMWDRYKEHLCSVCMQSHLYSREEPQAYSDIDRWWTKDGQCYEGRKF